MRSNSLAGVTVANLFGEPSTRAGLFRARRTSTRRRHREPRGSPLIAEQGRDTVLDTVYTLEAMQIVM